MRLTVVHELEKDVFEVGPTHLEVFELHLTFVGPREKPSERRARERAEAIRRTRKLMRKRMEREGY